MSHDNLFQPKTQVRAFQSYYDAKEEHINNIQNVMDKIDGEDEKQFFFNKYGKGNSNFIYHFDILGESEYILTLTSTKVKPRSQMRKPPYVHAAAIGTGGIHVNETCPPTPMERL